MSTRETVEAAIATEMTKRKKRVLNKNAFGALLAVTQSTEALGKIFLGRSDALDAERDKLMQEVMLDLLCKIQDALEDARVRADRVGQKSVFVSGTIEASGERVEAVTGLHIEDESGPVHFRPGTIVSARGTDARTVTGVRVGGKKKGA